MNIKEIPVRFYKDRAGRLSHHKRSGWFSPWQAGWINLRVMLLGAPDFFLLVPGLALLLPSFALACITAFFQPSIGPVSLDLHWLYFFICCTLAGYHCVHLGLLGKFWHDYNPEASARFKEIFSYNRGMVFSILLVIIGCTLCIPLVAEYIFSPKPMQSIHYAAFLGGMFVVMGLQTMGFTLLLTLQAKDIKKYKQGGERG